MRRCAGGVDLSDLLLFGQNSGVDLLVVVIRTPCKHPVVDGGGVTGAHRPIADGARHPATPAIAGLRADCACWCCSPLWKEDANKGKYFSPQIFDKNTRKEGIRPHAAASMRPAWSNKKIGFTDDRAAGKG